MELDRKTARQKDRVKNEEIPYSLFLEFQASYEEERKEIQKELDITPKGVSNPEECVDLAIQYALKLPSLWSLAEYREKQRLQFMVFPEGIFYNRKTDECRTGKVTGVFPYMAALERGLRESKSRNADDLSSVAALVVPMVTTANKILEQLRIIWESDTFTRIS